MIKRYDSYLIPARSTVAYPDIDYSLPKGPAFATAMHVSAIKALQFYTYSVYPYETQVELQSITEFTSFLKLTRPKQIRNQQTHRFNPWIFENPNRNRYFRTSDEAYIDMFLNYRYTVDKYPDIHNRLYSGYPEYFI